jgi:hypothetical protein
MSVNFLLLDNFMKNLGKKLIDLNGDSFKAILTNTAPTRASDATYAGISANEIANGNGYTTGGVALTTGWTQVSGGHYKFTCAAFNWASSSAGLATFRYGYIRDITNDFLVGYWDHGGALSVAVGNQYQVTPDQTNGLFDINYSP